MLYVQLEMTGIGIMVAVFAENTLAAAVLTVLVMDRIGAEKYGMAFLFGVVGSALYVAAHFVLGPMFFTLTKMQMMSVVAVAGAGVGVGVTVSVVLFRPRSSPSLAGFVPENHSKEEIEL